MSEKQGSTPLADTRRAVVATRNRLSTTHEHFQMIRAAMVRSEQAIHRSYRVLAEAPPDQWLRPRRVVPPTPNWRLD